MGGFCRRDIQRSIAADEARSFCLFDTIERRLERKTKGPV